MRFVEAFLVLWVLLVTPGTAIWRMLCADMPQALRLDAIISPGQLSSHAHKIHGGSGFTWNATTNSLLESEGTTCGAAQDKSAYWTPALMFMYSNGTVQSVRQVGGMLAYHLLHGANITAFPNGFQMIADDTFQRNFT